METHQRSINSSVFNTSRIPYYPQASTSYDTSAFQDAQIKKISTFKYNYLFYLLRSISLKAMELLSQEVPVIKLQLNELAADQKQLRLDMAAYDKKIESQLSDMTSILKRIEKAIPPSDGTM